MNRERSYGESKRFECSDILQLLWPGQAEGATAAFSSFHPLVEGDFAGVETLGPRAQLKDECVGAVVDEVEGLRARAVGARHAFLVREFAMEARKEGLKVLTTLERTLVLSAPSGSQILDNACHRCSQL